MYQDKLTITLSGYDASLCSGSSVLDSIIYQQVVYTSCSPNTCQGALISASGNLNVSITGAGIPNTLYCLGKNVELKQFQSNICRDIANFRSLQINLSTNSVCNFSGVIKVYEVNILSGNRVLGNVLYENNYSQ